MRGALPSGTILGSRESRGRGRGDRDADARGGDPAAARRPGLSRRRRSVRGRRALGGETRVVASILAAGTTVLQARGNADARRQAGGAPPGALRVLRRRGGHRGGPHPGQSLPGNQNARAIGRFPSFSGTPLSLLGISRCRRD